MAVPPKLGAVVLVDRRQVPLIGHNYCVATLLRSRFSIDRKSVAPALKALQDWNQVQVGYNDRYDSIAAAQNLADAVHAVGFDLVEDQHGNVTAIQQHDCDVDSDWHESAMASMETWIESGSFMLFISDDEEFYQWVWIGEKFEVWVNGSVVFPHQLKKLKKLTDHIDQWIKDME